MKVKELVAKLLEMDQELPVAVADWNEDYRYPSEAAAEFVETLDCMYDAKEATQSAMGRVVVIGWK